MSSCVKNCQFQLKSVKTIESAEEKLGWIFTAFDEDGGGFMDPDEVAQIVLGLFRLVQQQHHCSCCSCCCYCCCCWCYCCCWWGWRWIYGSWWSRPDCARTIQVSSITLLLLLLLLLFLLLLLVVLLLFLMRMEEDLWILTRLHRLCSDYSG